VILVSSKKSFKGCAQVSICPDQWHQRCRNLHL